MLPEGCRSQQEAVGKLFGVSASTIRNDYDLFLAIGLLTDSAREHVLSGVEPTRKQHVIDLAAIGPDAQDSVVRAIKDGRVKSLAASVIALRGKGGKAAEGGAVRHVPGMKCPTCGIRLAVGVTTCLRCDLGDKAITGALEQQKLSDQLGEPPVDYEERLRRVRESKVAEEGGNTSDAIEFHAGRIYRLLNEEDTPPLTHDAVKVVRKMVKRLAQIIDLSAGRAKLQGESAYQLQKRKAEAKAQ